MTRLSGGNAVYSGVTTDCRLSTAIGTITVLIVSLPESPIIQEITTSQISFKSYTPNQ